MKRVNRTVATSAIPIGIPGCPDFAASTPSIAKPRDRQSSLDLRDDFQLPPLDLLIPAPPSSNPAIDKASLERWVKEHGWETVLNRAGTTFRALPDAEKQGLDADKAIALMLAQPSMIKRPVLDLGKGKTVVGFKPEIYEAVVAKG